MKLKSLLKTTAIATALTSLALTAGCSGNAGEAGGDSGKLKVVAATTQIQDFVKQIAGDRVELTGLLKPGGSAHSFDPSPADLQALAVADVLIVNGAGLDDFLDSAVEAAGFNGEKVIAADGVDLDRAAELTAAGSTPDAAMSDGDGDSASDHSDHDHGDSVGDSARVNPHIWTSPEFAAAMVTEIAEGLGKADPDNAAEYSENAEAYTAKLTALDDWIKTEMAKADPEVRKFVSTHNALLYYLEAYEIEYVGSVIPSFEDNAEPSAGEINRLVTAIKAAGLKAIFVESSVSPKLSTTVANEAGAKVVTDPIYADSLGADGEAASYIGATVSNTRVMLEAWGVTVDPLPTELAEVLDAATN